jgi:hypothetical protein
MNPVFHISHLEPVIENNIPGRIQLPPPPIIINHKKEFEVNEILDSYIHWKRLEYLVDWAGYDTSHQKWEPAKYLQNAQQLIQEFHKCYPNKPRLCSAQSSERELLSQTQ